MLKNSCKKKILMIMTPAVILRPEFLVFFDHQETIIIVFMFEYVINKNSTILFSFNIIMYFQHGGQMIDDYINLLSFSVVLVPNIT